MELIYFCGRGIIETQSKGDTHMQKYFEVQAMCGHVGKRKYITISFPVAADNGREAAEITRRFPRVKHNHKNAILSVKEITFESYLQLKQTNAQDPYLMCKNIQQQRQIADLDLRICCMPDRVYRADKATRAEYVKHKLNKYCQYATMQKRQLQEYCMNATRVSW